DGVWGTGDVFAVGSQFEVAQDDIRPGLVRIVRSESKLDRDIRDVRVISERHVGEVLGDDSWRVLPLCGAGRVIPLVHHDGNRFIRAGTVRNYERVRAVDVCRENVLSLVIHIDLIRYIEEIVVDDQCAGSRHGSEKVGISVWTSRGLGA